MRFEGHCEGYLSVWHAIEAAKPWATDLRYLSWVCGGRLQLVLVCIISQSYCFHVISTGRSN